MKVQEKFTEENPVIIENDWGVTLTDNQGNRYEIKDDPRGGFEILCDTGNLILKPSCCNVVIISASK